MHGGRRPLLFARMDRDCLGNTKEFSRAINHWIGDANSAYTLADVQLFKALDEFKLMMLEQPLAHDDLFDQAKLQKEIKTPVCLDESIKTPKDAKHAIELGACRIINVKLGR